ncbi:MAG TPA: hypothetical protein VKW08_22285 [Xanthobacteraceae bacterium]|nr:hypothetical protein [Xanthobacteraceae bacterium]
MLLLGNEDVAKVLDMPLCLSALDGVFQEMAAGEAVGMGRIDLYVPSQAVVAPYYRWAVMTGGGRTDSRETSFFLNVGAIGAQFEGVAAAVYNKARDQGLGTEIPTEWFLQDIRD